METTLLIVSILSLALAIGMSVLGWKLLRDDRRRSAARVEMLELLAASDATSEEYEAPRRDPTEARRATPRADEAPRVDVEDDWVMRPSEEFDRSEALPAVLPSSMFGATVDRSSSPRRRLAMAITGLVMAVSAGTVYAIFRPAQVGAARNPDTTEKLVVPAGSRPLELLSLRHTVDQTGSFTVTGLVQNPSDGQALPGVVAVVFLFDRDGNYLASGRAPLEFGTLSAGDESPFVVRVSAAAGAIGRYRVGFRYERGGVVAHVDRRGQPVEGTTTGSVGSRKS